ncbi:MAG: hypothetical protein FWD68_07825 [Alphaproteobacteria bacterium]|nr:hypothetical protein [Alphaproteobacteria bacterium]
MVRNWKERDYDEGNFIDGVGQGVARLHRAGNGGGGAADRGVRADGAVWRRGRIFAAGMAKRRDL